MVKIFFQLAVLCLLFCGCGKPPPAPAKPIVLVSIPPYAYFVKKIAGDAVDVETLIPAGANPHVYEALPREVERHQNASAWVYLGDAFDIKVRQFFEDVHKQIAIVDVTEGIALLSLGEEHDHHEEGKDLHVWLSPRLAQGQAQRIAEMLYNLIPENKEAMQANLTVFEQQLVSLDGQISNMLAPFKGRAILVSHPAFGYFCQDYDLVQLSIEFEGKEPLPQYVTKVLQQAKQYQVQSVIVEPQYSNKGAELIAQSLGLPTHSVNPYAEDYSANLLYIAKVICQK